VVAVLRDTPASAHTEAIVRSPRVRNWVTTASLNSREYCRRISTGCSHLSPPNGDRSDTTSFLTQGEFSAGNLDFHSTAYEWLVVAGPQAQFKGSGTINDSGDYGFLLTGKYSAIQGGPAKDTFRIKIWDKGTGLTVYDNGTDQPIGGGNVVIH